MNFATQTFFPTPITEIARHIRTVPDFPKPGISFKDITPLLAQPEAFQRLVSHIAQQVRESGANTVVGLESRGFLIGIPVAQELGLPFVPARKAGKLPGDVIAVEYGLEYGQAKLELQRDSLKSTDTVAIVDDLLATGGSARAAAGLVEALGAKVAGFFFAIELADLGGRDTLGPARVNAALKY